MAITPTDMAASATLNTALSAMTPSLSATLIDVVDLKTSAQRIEWNQFNTNLRKNSLLANGLVTTYTYKQFMGITSSTDPNGITTYYEYDCFGRLIYIRDNDYRIIKKYDYHYAGQ